MRLLLTAGFDRALHAVALAELARRDGHEIAAVLVVSSFEPARIRAWLRKRGARSLFDAARRSLGAASDRRDEALEELLAREGIEHRSLSSWPRAHGIARHVVGDLNERRAIELASAARADGTLYAGGGILKQEFLRAVGGRVLNAHSGSLPAVRGMNACEWSVLLGRAPAVTIHWIDEGIDTGPVVEEIAVPIEPGDTVEALRGKCAVLGVEGLRRAIGALSAPLPARAGSAARARQCFALAPVMRELLEARLKGRT